MWHGANKMLPMINKIERIIIPLKTNRSEGRIDNAKERNTLLFLKHNAQMRQYKNNKLPFTMRYIMSALGKKNPKYV